MRRCPEHAPSNLATTVNDGYRSWGWGVLTPWKYVGGVSMFWPPSLKCHIFSFKTLLLYNCKFHSIKDEQLDTITSLILVMLMLPSLCLISSKQTVSSSQFLSCSTGLKVIVAQDKTPKRGCRLLRLPIVNNPHRSRLTCCPPTTDRLQLGWLTSGVGYGALRFKLWCVSDVDCRLSLSVYRVHRA